MTTLEEIRLSIRVLSCDEQSLYSYVASHAHCAIRLLWVEYANSLNEYALESFNIHFWRWENASPHPDEDGLNRNARITTVVFESNRWNGRLTIRARVSGNTIETRYKAVRYWEGGDTSRIRTKYLLGQTVPQDVPAQPFILSRKFHHALGSLLEHPTNGQMIRRH
jgi:hypothetical protein